MEQTFPALIIEIADRIRPFVEKLIGTNKRHLHKKSKYILEEDSHWVDEANEDVISLLSSSFTEENSTILPLSATKGKYYPLLFLTLMVITNIYPLIANCSIGTHDVKCMRLTSENLSTFQLAIYQIGNICCTLLAFGIMWNLFRLQKSKLPASYLRWNTLNFLLGSLGVILFFAFVLVNSQNENGLDQEITGQNILNFYSIIAMAYSFYNLRVMKTRVGRQREASARKRMACYIFKNAYYLVMLSATIFYFILQVSQFMLSEQDPQSVLSVLMMNYNEIMRTICVIMSQAYIALYYIDINYIYEDGFSSEKKEQFENKKLMLSML